MQNPGNTSSVGGIVLCGGRSLRMGQPKLTLSFGPELMIQRVVRILESVVSPVVIVAAPAQDVPSFSSRVRVVRDAREHLGPLAGLATGLDALKKNVKAAYVSGCDVPLLKPDFIQFMIDASEGYDLAVPSDGTFQHPLAGAYGTHLAETAWSLIDVGRMRPAFLFDVCDTHFVEVEQLRAIDRELVSLHNVNTREDYLTALKLAGFQPVSSK